MAQSRQDEAQKYPPLGEFDNQKALADLKREQHKRVIYCIGMALGIATGGFLNAGFGVILAITIKTELRRLENVSHIIRVMEMILNEFSNYNVEVIPQVEVPKEETGVHQIDLFVRVPEEKVYFSMCIRRMRHAKVVFHKKKQRLMIRRKGKRGLNPLNPDPIDFLGASTSWIQKNQRSLFGRASNDRRRPCAKVLCLVEETEIAKQDSTYYANLGNDSFLCLRKEKSPIFVLHAKYRANNLCRFIHNFIEANGKQQSKVSA